MSYVPPILDFVAKKIARIEGVELSCVTREGAIDVILEGGYNRDLRSHILGIGMKAMVPVRVFYRMPDGRAIGESDAQHEYRANAQVGEAIEDYYTRIHVAGFADDPAKAPPDEVAGDAYGTVDVKKDVDPRDGYGQLKLTRIRGTTRGRPVVGWKYGDHTVRKGSVVRFKKDACLNWTMGRTMGVKAGANGTVTGLASKRPLAYLSMGGYDQIELPVHAVGHVYDVMVDPKLESGQLAEAKGRCNAVDNTLGYLSPEMKRLVMTVGFGRPPGADDTPINKPKFRGPQQPDLIGYQAKVDDGTTTESSEEDATEDDLRPPVCGKGDAWTAACERDPRVTIKRSKGAAPEKAQMLLGKNR